MTDRVDVRGGWGGGKAKALPTALATLLGAQLLVLGGNGPLLAVAFAALDILFAASAVLLLAPSDRFWRSASPALAVLGCAIAWLIVPRLLPAMPAARVQAAPDLLLPAAARVAGFAALLLGAGIVGFRRGLMRLCLDRLILLGLAIVLTGLVLRNLDPAHVWGFAKPLDPTRFTGTLLNANANACASGVFAILAFGRWQALLRQERTGGKGGELFLILCGLATIAALGACALSGSRMVLSATVAGMALLALLDRGVRQRLPGRAALWVTAAALAVAAGVLMLFGQATIGRFATLGSDGVERVTIWTHYARLAAAQPWFGYGPNSFAEINLGHLNGAEQGFAFWYINAAHDEIIELALAGGLPYAALLVGATILLAWPALRHGGRHEDDPVVRAVPVALAVIAADAMVDIALEVPAILALAIGLVGMAWGRGLRVRSDKAIAASIVDGA